MNMLIIGNGFDLAHKQPTTYSDFLQFLDYILLARDYTEDRSKFESDLNINCDSVKDYILSSFDTRRNLGNEGVWNSNRVIQELYDCLDKNVWYEYFQFIHKENKMHGKNWIDFEGEIREVIECFDRAMGDIYDIFSNPNNLTTHFSVKSVKIDCFCKRLDFTDYNKVNGKSSSYKNTFYDFIEKSYQDLQKLVRCLEIYLDDCVAKMHITYYSPDIKKLKIDFVMSFNYTAFPADIYSSLANTHYIHGYAKTDRTMEKNNMVLGVNEYWDSPDKNVRTNFNLYKKFVQRIIKETGIDYKKVLEDMFYNYNEAKADSASIGQKLPSPNHVYIFGHSLDASDGDILKEVIQTEGVVSTIFYRNKQQQANQIANLSKVLGQEKLLECMFSTSPTIIFRQQSKMHERVPFFYPQNTDY